MKSLRILFYVGAKLIEFLSFYYISLPTHNKNLVGLDLIRRLHAISKNILTKAIFIPFLHVHIQDEKHASAEIYTYALRDRGMRTTAFVDVVKETKNIHRS